MLVQGKSSKQQLGAIYCVEYLTTAEWLALERCVKLCAQVLHQFACARNSKIDRMDTETAPEPITIFGPCGNKGQHGSGPQTLLSGSKEPHVLVVFLSERELNSELKEYLNTEDRCGIY